VRVEGELDVAGEARFAAVLDRCQATSALAIVDLRGLEFLSCGGLRALLSAAHERPADGSWSFMALARSSGSSRSST
jgi:anti-anti-sigma factor